MGHGSEQQRQRPLYRISPSSSRKLSDGLLEALGPFGKLKTIEMDNHRTRWFGDITDHDGRTLEIQMQKRKGKWHISLH